MTIQEAHQYVQAIHGEHLRKEVSDWIDAQLFVHIKKHPETTTTDIEHVLDYIVSEQSPKNLMRMSFLQGVEKAVKWTTQQNKKAEKIEELPEDTKLIHDFQGGFKIVQLVGERA
jgi:hypothetical protein